VLIFSGCSSSKHKEEIFSSPEQVTESSFKKEKPLKASEVKDFYPQTIETINPVLQDETLDRHSEDELEALESTNDPLIEINLKCSQKNFKEAFTIASKAFHQFQKVPAYWNQIANCHLNQGSIRKALLFYNKALEVSPNYVPALNNIGVLYSRQGENQKALLAFERANKQSKFAKTPRYNLARLYLSYGLSESALPLFQGLLGDSKDVDLLNAVASSYFMMSDYQRAFSYYQKIPQELWSQAEIGLNAAVTLKKLGKQKEALDAFSDVDKPKEEALKAYYSSVSKYLGAK
jgi:tetratricopeptide (TPR) repeat protein